MGIEIDLLENYPRAKRDVFGRAQAKTESDRAIARRFDKDFFDGDRKHGYGGFSYHERFWKPVIPTFIEHWSLSPESKLLDVGCAKGFMLHDIVESVPGIDVRGVDISSYAIRNAIETMAPFVSVANATNLPFEDRSFDVVVSINTIHNLDLDECIKALFEIERVSRKKSYVTVDAYRNDEEKERMFAWNLTAKTILSVDDWRALFKEIRYTGDFYWFVP